MQVNIEAWCTYKEFYSLDITEQYLEQMNEWFAEKYPDKVDIIGEITIEDIHNVFSPHGEWSERLDIELDSRYNLGEFIDEYVREDVWESYEDNEYYDMSDYEVKVEYDTSAEREALCGSDD